MLAAALRADPEAGNERFPVTSPFLEPYGHSAVSPKPGDLLAEILSMAYACGAVASKRTEV